MSEDSTDYGAWWEQFHVPEMADLFLARDDQWELEATLAFLRCKLRLGPGSRVYDQCCGIGSLSIAMAREGIHATGADLCTFFIERARGDAQRAGIACDYHCADAFDFVPAEPCDAVINWYSSFGYAASDRRNRKMLERAFDALRPGGGVALDVPSFPGVLRRFQRALVRRGTSSGKSVVLIRESTINHHQGMLEQVWTWMVDGRPSVERRSALRIYWPYQIVDMLRQCGFSQIELYGDVNGQEYSLDSPRLLLTASRPES